MKPTFNFLALFLFIFIACEDDSDVNYKYTDCRMIEEKISTYYEPSVNNPGGKEETEIYEYQYEKGNLIEKRHFNKSGEFDYWLSFSYNKNNELSHCVIHIVELQVTDTLIKYIFDEKQRLSKIILYKPDNITNVNEIALEETITYSDLKTITYTSEDYEWDYTVDSKDNLVEVIQTKSPDSNNSYSRAFYKYDNGKNPYKGLPERWFNFLEFYSSSNLIGSVGFTDSTRVNDTSIKMFSNPPQIEYNDYLYPVKIEENIGGAGFNKVRTTKLTYDCF